jgi:CheY-like chemotaxis protein
MKRRILLADDSVTIQKVIELTFMDEDYEVRAVSNGDEAVKLLSEMSPDFVIADVHMPGANGYEVCRKAKQLRPGTPVLLLVGTFEPFDEAQARSAGADSFLKKPFDSQELLQRVEELIAAKAPAATAPSPPLAPSPLPSPAAIPAAAALPDWAAAPAPTPIPMPASSMPAPAPLPDWAAAPTPPPAPAPVSAPISADTDWAAPAPTAPAPAVDTGWTSAEPTPDWLAQPTAPELAAVEPPAADGLGFMGAAAVPAFAPEATWGNFELEPEPAATPVAPAEHAAPEPFDREPSFSLEPDPAYHVEAEPVFSLEEGEPTFGVREDVFGAPSELSLDETQDHYPLDHALEEPAIEEPAMPAAGFNWAAAPAPEPAFPPGPTVSAAPAPEPAFPPGPTASAVPANGNGHLSEEDVDRIARRVVELLGDKTVRDVAWEVIPDMAEVIIRDRLRELEGQVE